jgi:hypothetical protein
MGGAISQIPSIEGNAIYVIYDGTERDKSVMEQLVSHLERRTRKQLFLLSARDDLGRQIVHYFHLRGTHFVLIITSHKQLHHMWTDGDLFDAAHIAYLAEQAH